MQFSITVLLFHVAVTFAGAVPGRSDDIAARTPQSSSAPPVQAEAAAMTDKNGNIVAFNAAGVYQAAAAAGI